MEPAMILCAAVAISTLGIWMAGRAGSLVASIPDRLAEPFTGAVPARAMATAVLAVIGFSAVPRSASADPVPPIVRLADEPEEPAEGPPQIPNPAGTTSYEVRRGDSLWCIAAGHLEARTGERPTSAAIAAFWPSIYKANKAVIGDDPDLIHPGQRFTIPES